MKQRLLYIDIIKLLAIVCVVMCHVPMLWSLDMMGEQDLWLYGTNVVGALGVPLFVMCTGALVLQKDLSDKASVVRFYRKNLLTVYVTGVTWSLLYYLHATDAVTLKGVVRTLLLVEKPAPHLWYIRMIVMYYVLMPVLTWLLHRRVWWFVGLTVAAAAATFGWNAVRMFVLGDACPTTSGVSMASYLVYMTLGYWLARSEVRIGNTCLLLLALAGAVTLLWARATTGLRFLWYDNPLTLVSAVCLFLCVKQLSSAARPNEGISIMSAMTFGVYLCHLFVLMWLGEEIVVLTGNDIAVGFALATVSSLAISFAAVRLCKAVLPPPINRWLFRC